MEKAAEADPHGLTPGRMATFLEVEKEVTDHYDEFAIQAKLDMPHMPGLCEQEEDSMVIPTASLLQSESVAAAANSERHSRAVAAVLHTQRAAARTARALSDHTRLHLLEASFFTHTWKKACAPSHTV